MVLKQSQTPYKRKTDVFERSFNMIYSHEVEKMCTVAQGVNPWRRSDSGRSKMGKV